MYVQLHVLLLPYVLSYCATRDAPPPHLATRRVAREREMEEHWLSVSPRLPLGAVSWSEENLLAVACEHSVIILVRAASSLRPFGCGEESAEISRTWCLSEPGLALFRPARLHAARGIRSAVRGPG